MKAGRLGSSFGFLALETSDRGDGVKVIEAIDLFEVSVTAAPANADTRIISTKSADEYDRIRGEFSRHLYDLLTTPLASESLPSRPDRSKRHAPTVVRPMRLTDAQRSWLSSARARMRTSEPVARSGRVGGTRICRSGPDRISQL
jgi:Caudovirus prohead serine protease